MSKQPTPEVGQVWRDLDPRMGDRHIRIVAIDGDKATIMVVCRLSSGACRAPIRRHTRAKLSRFNGRRTGYGFVE